MKTMAKPLVRRLMAEGSKEVRDEPIPIHVHTLGVFRIDPFGRRVEELELKRE